MIFDCIVLCGGNSPERQISLLSGFAVAKALHELSYKVAILDPALGEFGLQTWPIDLRALQKASCSHTYSTHLSALLHLIRSKSFDRQKSIFFVALHGTWGEDGRAQALLDTLECRYTGSDFAASALAMNKSAAKALVNSVGIPVSSGVEIDQKQIANSQLDVVAQAVRALLTKDPKAKSVVVKPKCQGSSIATECLSIVDYAKITAAVQKACCFSHSALIELFIEGREFTAAILEDRALPLVEICAQDQFSDFKGKYESEMTTHHCPTTLAKHIEVSIKSAALLAHRTLGARSFSRSDFRVDKNGNFFFLELNTLPGLTPKSLFPKAALANGMGFSDLCRKIYLSAL